MTFNLTVNGIDHVIDVDGDAPLLWVLGSILNRTGTKLGRVTTIDNATGAAITTIEAVRDRPVAHSTQEAWLDPA